jgi:RNA polymerase sigma-70 factor (ECF subfamily)
VIDPSVEARIVAALRGRDARAREAALGELFALVGRPLQQLCLRVAGDATDADDAVQETFVDVLRGLGGFRADARLSTWMFRIAIRAALRVRSRRGRAERDVAAFEQHDVRVDAPDPGDVAIERESTARVLAAIERLPAAQRTVLGLAALDEMPQAEIAAILGVPVGTVYSRLSAARASLRALLAR